MTIDNEIIDEKLQYDINREAAKYQHYIRENWQIWNLTDKQILPSDQRRIREQTKFTYSPLQKAF